MMINLNYNKMHNFHYNHSIKFDIQYFADGNEEENTFPFTDDDKDTDGFYKISSAADLIKLANYVNSGIGHNCSGISFKLTQNISFKNEEVIDETGSNFIAIGNSGNSFKGIFDGNGKIISDIKINKSENDYQGLFGYVNTGGRIENIILKNSEIQGRSFVGGIVGYLLSGSINNCCVGSDVVISGSTSKLGGIAGSIKSEGTIKNCFFLGAYKNSFSAICGSKGESDYSNKKHILNSYYIDKEFQNSSGYGNLLYKIEIPADVTVESFSDEDKLFNFDGEFDNEFNKVFFAPEGTHININIDSDIAKLYTLKTSAEDLDKVLEDGSTMIDITNANINVAVKTFWTGTGTEDDPYIVSTAEGLNHLSDLVTSETNLKDKYFYIDLGDDVQSLNDEVKLPTDAVINWNGVSFADEELLLGS